MKAIVCHQPGPLDNLVYEDVPTPHVGPHNVLVETHAMGLNFTDLLAVTGRSQLGRALPMIAGVEGAGVVKSVGDSVITVKPGDRVMAVSVRGVFSEEALFDESEVCVIPDEMPMDVAATFFTASFTADYALHDRAKLKAGELLLVLGAGSGAGISAIQIGKSLGATVIAAASSEDKLDLAREAGADGCVLYPAGDLDRDASRALVKELLALAPRPAETLPGECQIPQVKGTAGYHAIYDVIGGSYSEPAIRAIGWEGRYLSVGFSGGVPKVSLGPLLFKNADILAIQPADDNVRLPGKSRAMPRLIEWWRNGSLRPLITARFHLSEAADALRMMEERRARGRIVLKTDQYRS